MKQYDFARAWKDDADYDIEGPVILLTIEEAIEMWSAAERRDRWFFEREEFEKQGLPEPPDLSQYLTSKGITL